MRKLGLVSLVLVLAGLAGAAETLTITFDNANDVVTPDGYVAYAASEPGGIYVPHGNFILEAGGITGNAVMNNMGSFANQYGNEMEFTGAYFKTYSDAFSGEQATKVFMEGFGYGGTLGVVQVDLMDGISVDNGFQFAYCGWENVLTVKFWGENEAGGMPAFFLMDNVILSGNADFAPAAVPAPSALLLATGGTCFVGWLRRRKSL